MRRLWRTGGELLRACLYLFYLEFFICISSVCTEFITFISDFSNIYPSSATRPRDKSERERSQLQHSQMLATQRPPTKVLSQSPPQSSSYREKERDRELSPKVSAADARHQVSQSPSLSPRRHAQQPHIVVSRPQPSSKDREKEADHEEFSRRLRISSSPRPHHIHSHGKSPKLFDPHHDPIPTRRSGGTEDQPFDGEWDREREREREREKDRDSREREREPTNSTSRGNPRQLFDHRKDDPVRFSVLARPSPAQQAQAQITSVLSGTIVTRPTPKYPPNDHVSASSTSTSSYAASISSSAFTLSSTTDGSSASSALFEGRGGQGQGNGTDDSGNSVFSIQLKKLYRALTNLETKIKQEESFVGSSMEDGDAGMNGMVVFGGKEKNLIIRGKDKETKVPYVEPGESERECWKKIINDHKECVCLLFFSICRGFTPYPTGSRRSATIFSRSRSRPPSPHHSAIYLRSTTSLYASGPTVSTNSSSPFAVLPSTPHLPSSICKISFTMHIHFTPGY